MLEKTLENPLDCKGIKPVDLKANQPWIFIGGIDAGAKALILWWPNEKNPFTEKDPDAGKAECRTRRGGRRWDCWMASLTQWTWISANSGRWWRKGSLVCYCWWGHRVRHNLVTEQQQIPNHHRNANQNHSEITQQSK